MKVRLQLADIGLTRYGIPSEETFTLWANAAVRSGAEVVVRIVDESESRLLNGRYGGRREPTNVLAFPYACTPADECGYLGDIVMNAPLVMREAREQEREPRAHWAHLFIHALLHLTGYDHDTEEATVEMRARETDVLSRLNMASPWMEE